MNVPAIHDEGAWELLPTNVPRRVLSPVATGPALLLPAPIVDAGERAARRYVEFFAATVRNPNTRAAYARAVGAFFAWCGQRGIRLGDLDSVAVASYVEAHPGAAPTRKQHLAAIRMCLDYLVSGGVLPFNPATAVRGPRHVVRRGKTPVISADETRRLLDHIGGDDVLALRDRALVATMVFSFARIGAVVAMRVRDYFQHGRRHRLRLHEKGGKQHEVPAHHRVEEYLDAYLEAAGIGPEKDSPLFRAAAPARQGRGLGARGLSRFDATRAVQRRARQAGLGVDGLCSHTFRATGITVFLSNGGALEDAQAIAAHESPTTTRLYDRRGEEISLHEIERIVI